MKEENYCKRNANDLRYRWLLYFLCFGIMLICSRYKYISYKPTKRISLF